MEPAKRRTVDVVAAITTVITPYVGSTMARAATEAHCHKLGLDGPEIAPEQIDSLVARIGSGLNIFVGRTKTSALVDDMRRAVERLPAA